MAQSATHAAKHAVVGIPHQLAPGRPVIGEGAVAVRCIASIRRALLKVVYTAHLGDNLLYVGHRDNFLAAGHDTLAKHLGDAVFNVTHDLMAVGGIAKMTLYVDHIGTQDVIRLLFDMEYDPVYVDDNRFIHGI